MWNIETAFRRQLTIDEYESRRESLGILLLNLNITEGQRDQQHLYLFWGGRESQQKSEDIVNSLHNQHKT
jgi:hypothetical protein